MPLSVITVTGWGAVNAGANIGNDWGLIILIDSDDDEGFGNDNDSGGKEENGRNCWDFAPVSEEKIINNKTK